MNRKILAALILIMVFGVFFRFWKLSDFPVSLSIDEVGVGYNAYSILKTGRDEFGIKFPLAFRSVGDYKSPLLIYFTVPSIATFGLNEFGQRLPMAFVGTLTVLIVFFLIKEMTKNEYLSLLGAFSLAISPWHVFFSRFSHDSILGLFFVLLGVWLFLRAVNNQAKGLWLAAIPLAFSMYSYHVEKIFTPALTISLVIIYKDVLLKYKKSLLRMLLLLFLILIPLLKMLLGPEGQTRAKMTFLAQDENISYQLHQNGEHQTLLGKLLDNNLIILGNFWVKRYLNYWDPHFLFFKGMQFSLPKASDSGLFYLFEMPLFVIGLCFFFFKKISLDKNSRRLIIFWLLLGPLAASLTNNEQHASRSLTTIPIPQILIALGGYYLITTLSKWSFQRRFFVFLSIICLVVVNVIYVVDLYFVHYPIQFSEWWDFGYKEASLYALGHQNEYREIVVDNTFGTLGPYIVGTPHLYVLFYGEFDPVITQKERANFGENFSNFTFRTIYWPKDRFQKNTLFIASPWRIPLIDVSESQILKRIYFKNGQLGFLIVKTS